MFFIAVDGLGSKSKMSQQRMRRFKTFYERKEIKKLEEKHGIKKRKQIFGTPTQLHLVLNLWKN